jgi:HEAT repeat protein
MKRRGRLILISACCVVVALLVIRTAVGPTEPTYRGKTLSFWAKQATQDPTPEQEEEARTALRVLCTNQIPALLNALAYDDNPRRDKLERAIRWLPARVQLALLNTVLVDKDELRSETAERALQALGEDAAPAIPTLTRFLESTNELLFYKGCWVLPHLGTNGLQPLLRIAVDPNTPRRRRAQAIISTKYAGTNAAVALPVLISATQDKDPVIVQVAVDTLGMLHMDAQITIPAITAALAHPDPTTRIKAIQAIQSFRPPAPEAIASLTKALQDPTPSVRETATNALLYIAPTALPNATAP